MLNIKKQEQGVVSLEACIVLPIFIFVLMFFYGFIVFFSGHQVMAHTMIQSAESLSLDPFAAERINTEFKNSKNGKDVIQALYSTLFTSNDGYFSSNEKWYANNDDRMIKAVRNRFVGYLAGTGTASEMEKRADDKLKTIGVKNGLAGLDFSETKIEGNILTITVKYKQEFIFNFQGLAAFDREQKISITLWDVAKE